ncbi:MAG: substrate-binding domain-containing protein [Prochloraceae cyanobacterium]
MSKLVVLNINSEYNQTFSLTLKIGQEGHYSETEIAGSLPSAKELVRQYEDWQSIYRRLEYSFRLKHRLDTSFKLKQHGKINPIESEIENYIERQIDECRDRATSLKKQLNDWLDCREFRQINRRLREQLNPEEKIRFLIRTASNELRKLPWHLWDFLDRYPFSEITLGAPEYQKATVSTTPANQVKILAIFGYSSGINILKDKQELIKKLPNAKITVLEEPQPEQLKSKLWRESWDILFFAGHSQSEAQRGRININQSDSLTIEEIKSAVKKAIERGLQLAIFNSCDGLGLASELEKLHIPQMIVMREPVPDVVAQQFLLYFLPIFASGAPLHLAVRSAREMLQDLEYEFPCVSWLPVIWQNPAFIPPTWSDLVGKQLSQLNHSAGDRKEAEVALNGSKTEDLKLRSPILASQTQSFDFVTTSPVLSPQSPEIQQVSKKKPDPKIKLTFIGIGTLAIAALLLLGVIRWTKTTTTSSSTASKRESSPQNSPIISQPKRYSIFREIANVPNGTFRYGGSTTWAVIRREVDPAIAHVWPEFKLLYVEHPTIPPSSGTGVKMLLSEGLSIAQTSRPLKPKEYRSAEDTRFKIKQIPVAIDGIAFAVNHNLKIPGLTLAQLRDIYTGKITNWQQVGGPNLEIIPYSKAAQVSGTAEFFVNHILNKEEFASRVTLVTNITNTIRKVATQRGAIFYASAPEIVHQCSVKPLALGRTSQELIPPYQEPLIPREKCGVQRNQLNQTAFQDASYPLTRNLYVIVKQNGLDDERAGEIYAQLLLSDQGQKLIEKAGFVPIH